MRQGGWTILVRCVQHPEMAMPAASLLQSSSGTSPKIPYRMPASHSKDNAVQTGSHGTKIQLHSYQLGCLGFGVGMEPLESRQKLLKKTIPPLKSWIPSAHFPVPDRLNSAMKAKPDLVHSEAKSQTQCRFFHQDNVKLWHLLQQHIAPRTGLRS